MSYLGMDTWDLVFLLPELNKEKQQMQGMLHVYVWIYTSVVSSVTRSLTHRNKKIHLIVVTTAPNYFKELLYIGSRQFRCLRPDSELCCLAPITILQL